MSLLEVILLLIAAVLISSLVSQISNKISTPLFQIAIGFIIALAFNSNYAINIDSELFLVLFIAPLLFNEAKHVDKLGFWKNKGMIISLALGLVVATTLSVGFVTNIIEPSIPLAAAFALGAALGPTDAVAVTSMNNVANLSQKQKSILNGECLINDASGLVAFQFSIAAAMTGTFSFIEAGTEFLISFFGGILLGALLGVVSNIFISFVRDRGLEDRTFHVLFEVMTPFIVFILAESLGVSGVLAVVTCGVVFSISSNSTGPNTSKMNIVSSSVWDVISFTLNGVVFVLLGMMLPSGIMREIEGEVSSLNFELLSTAIIVTFIVILTRFLWVLFNERVFGSAEEINKGLIKYSAILSFAGAKGAITLMIIMTVSSSLSYKSEMVFIASVAIITTLLLANFIVPILAPANNEDLEEERHKNLRCYIKILRGVVDKLNNDCDEAILVHQKLAYQTVIDEYSKLIIEMKEKNDISSQDEENYYNLQSDTIKWQLDYLQTLVREKDRRFNIKSINKHRRRLENREQRLKNNNIMSLKFEDIFKSLKDYTITFANIISPEKSKTEDNDYKLLKNSCNNYVMGRLSSNNKISEEYTPEVIAKVFSIYQKNTLISKEDLSVTQVIKSSDVANDIRLKALHYENDLLDEAYSNKEINRHSANVLRRQISAQQLDIADEI